MLNPIEVQVVDDENAFFQLAPVWNSLLARSKSKSIFLTWEWVRTWWQVYGSCYRLLVLLATENGAPCGLAPLVIRSVNPPRLEFFGQNAAYGEYLDFIVPVGMEARITPLFCERLVKIGAAGHWERIALAVIQDTSPNFHLIRGAFRDLGVELRLSEPRLSPYVELPATWDEYLAIKCKSLSDRIGYNKRRLSRIGRINLVCADETGDIEPAFDDFVSLHNERWGREQDEVFVRFHRAIAKQFHPLRQVLLARLFIGDTVIAAKYDFIFDKKVWGYQGGWKPALAKFEIGSILLSEVLQHSIDHGFNVYDFLEGDAWYKRRWSTNLSTSYDLTYRCSDPTFIF